jgi:hypothetical protein
MPQSSGFGGAGAAADAVLSARIERGLAGLRGYDPEAIAVALRDLSLAGSRGAEDKGAKRLLRGPLKVEDEATALLMGKFYEGLLERKLEPAAALREAARAVRGFADKEGGRPYAKPRFWGAFVTYGR